MKNLFAALLLIVICVTLGGCPYESTVSIDTPSVKVDPKLIGTWKSAGSEDDKYKIAQLDEFNYSVVKHSKGSSEDEKYIGFFSVVNDAGFLNLYTDNGPDAASRQYYIYRVDMKGDGVMNVRELTENIDEEFTSSDELKKFIAANMNNSYFYEKDETLYTKQ